MTRASLSLHSPLQVEPPDLQRPRSVASEVPRRLQHAQRADSSEMGVPEVLHKRRKRLQEIEEREARGEVLWTDSFDAKARTKILHFFRDIGNDPSTIEGFSSSARNAILRSEGLQFLYSGNYGVSATEDLLNYLLNCDDDMVPTVIEAMCYAFKSDPYHYSSRGYMFESIVKTVLREHRISYDLIDGRMIEFSSRELHVSVVEPVLQLLARQDAFTTAEKTYRKSLKEISSGDPGDAITDAGTALQETLTELGCEGNALGPLIKSAVKKGLLGSHDSPMADALARVMNWVSADRSTKGDGHHASTASVEDAWLTVHIVGALILRLTNNIPRRQGDR